MSGRTGKNEHAPSISLCSVVTGQLARALNGHLQLWDCMQGLRMVQVLFLSVRFAYWGTMLLFLLLFLVRKAPSSPV